MANSSQIKYEDTIQCLFFLSSHLDIDWKNLCDNLNEAANAVTKDYIWHRDEFKITQPLLETDSELPPHLVSITCFGDNIEDEWFITYTIFKLTDKYPNLIVQIEDNDGDLLLIEAADFLPSWANPETTQNRVFIYNNHIHLIPPTLADLITPLELNDALKLIIENTEETKADHEIEQAILRRVCAYPNRIKELCHQATVTIPIEIASLLILKPTLLSNLVNVYCNHDDLDKKKFFKVKFDNCVDISLKFTKFQYAMLLHSKPVRNYVSRISLTTKASQIGFKLACAYNILVNETKKDKFSSADFKKFMNSLLKNGYFKGNIEGSKVYNQLLEKAKKYYMEMESPIRSYISEDMAQLMSTNEYVRTKELLKLDSKPYLCSEDNDDWLNVDPHKLDDLLNKNYGKQVQSDDLVTPSIVTSGLSNFLKQRSDFAGVEENENSCADNDSSIKFDADQFFKTVESMLDMVTLNVSDEDSSDFGDDDIENGFRVTEQQLEKELEEKMCNNQLKSLKEDASILSNLKHSIKEEGIVGPTSNILRSIGIDKSELLDSDDDIE